MMNSAKLQSFDDLTESVRALRSAGKRVVHCHGVLEPVKLGIIRLLQRARELGDVLVVTLAPTGGQESNGSRAEVLAALAVVDFVAYSRGTTAIDAIARLCPTVYVPGDGPLPGEAPESAFRLERAVVEAGGGRLVPLEIDKSDDGPAAANQPVLSREASRFLTTFANRYSSASMIAFLNSLRNLRVLLVGETIVDEYQYCETMGKSGKEPILAVKYLTTEKFAGGVVATANHAANFVDQVQLLSFLGERDSHEEFVRQKIAPNVQAHFLSLANTPTTIKRRYVETYPFQKLFEVYVINDEVEPADSRALRERLAELLPTCDAVLVTDYGHGLMNPEIVDFLCRETKFLAINTQTNAANQGFNTVSKYRRADFICVSEKELRLDARSRTRDLAAIMNDVADRLSCRHVLVTRGERGCVCYDRQTGFHQIPAFTQRIVDRVGAGDAVLSVATACVARGVPMEVVGFIGNAMGALAVETVGNRGPISRPAFDQFVTSLMNIPPYHDLDLV